MARTARTRSTDQERAEKTMGDLLRAGVLLAAATVAAGAAIYLYRNGLAAPHYSTFQGEPSDLRSLSGILRDAYTIRGRGIIQLGLILLIATPIARVLFSVVVFLIQRDRMYVVVTLIVLAALMYSLFGTKL